MGHSDSDDPYRDLPPDLVRTLRDPNVVLPGELEVFEHVHRWVNATLTNDGAGVYLDADGHPVPVRRDT